MNWCAVLLVCLFLPASLYPQTPPPAAQSPAPVAKPAISNPKTPEEFFARARQLSDLEAAGIPFHLKATYVASGDTEFTGNGTYEEWWQSKDVWRKEATLGDFRLVSLNSPKGPLLYATSRDIPDLLLDAMDAALITIEPDSGPAGNWRIKSKAIHGVKVTILSMKPRRVRGGAISGRVDRFTSDGALQIQQSFAAKTVYSDVRPFRSLLIPRTIESKFGQQRLLKVSVETLEPLKTGRGTTPKLAEIPNDLPLIGDYMVLSPGIMSRHLIHQSMVEYPKVAKAQRIQGRVIIAAIVNENGNIRDLHVIQSPSVLLSNASLDAVRQWRFQPTIVDGKAVAVDTTIRFEFTLREWPLFTR